MMGEGGGGGAAVEVGAAPTRGDRVARRPTHLIGSVREDGGDIPKAAHAVPRIT